MAKCLMARIASRITTGGLPWRNIFKLACLMVSTGSGMNAAGCLDRSALAAAPAWSGVGLKMGECK